MNSRRVIESAVGHRVAIDILPGSDALRLSRVDSSTTDAVILDQRGSRILSAFLASVMIIDIASRAAEELGDAYGTVITVHQKPGPMVRVTQSALKVDIHAPSWDALRCEIDLVIPRLVEPRPAEPGTTPMRH